MSDKEKTTSKRQGGLKRFLSSRKARHGGIAISITVIAIAMVIAINVIMSLLVDRFPDLKLDFTSNGAYALSDDTAEYMSHLKKDVTFYILAPEDDFTATSTYFVQAKNLLDKMEAKSDGKFHVEYIDTTANPTFAKDYPNIDWDTRTNVGVIKSDDRYKGLSIDDCFTYDDEYYQYYQQYKFTGTTIEQAAVKGALYVTSDENVLVDIITSEGEDDTSAIKTLLSDNAYDVKEVSLLTGQLDDEAQFAIIYAPTVDLSEASAAALEKWLDNGGRYGKTLLYFANSNPTLGEIKTPNLDSLLAKWGMKQNSGYAYETDYDHMLNGASALAFVTEYADSYTDGLKNPGLSVISYYAHPIELTDTNTAKAVLNTSTHAGIMPIDADESFDFEAGVKGEAIAVAAEGSRAGTDDYSRVIAFGSSAMFSSQYLSLGSFNNAAFLMNIFNTIADKDDDTVIIEGKALSDAELGITDAATANTMMIVFVFVIPIAVFVPGIIVWVRRRNK